MTGRLVTQKGLDLILASEDLLDIDAQFVFLGSGESSTKRPWSSWPSPRPTASASSSISPTAWNTG